MIHLIVTIYLSVVGSLWGIVPKIATASVASEDPGGRPPHSDQRTPEKPPILIDAKGGIICAKKQQVCTAVRDVIVRRDHMILTADQVKAFFRNPPEINPVSSPATPPIPQKKSSLPPPPKTDSPSFSPGEQNLPPPTLHRLEADGNVHIYSDTEDFQASGDHAVYQAQDESIQLTGESLWLHIQDIKIQAKDSLDYQWQEKKAVASGSAVATQKDKLLQSDHLVAYLREKAPQTGGGLTLNRIDAEGHVVISTPLYYCTGDKGVYEDQEKTASLYGNAVVSRAEGRMMGDRILINLETGVSQVQNQSPTKARVMLVPQAREIFEKRPRPSHGRQAPSLRTDTAEEKASSFKPREKTIQQGASETPLLPTHHPN